MAYGLKYQASFDSTAEETYMVNILEDGYSGDVLDIDLAGVPVKHNWDTDDPQAPVKGSSLVVSAYNKLGVDGGSFTANVSLSYYPAYGQNLIALNGSTFTPEVGVPFTISGHTDPIANSTWTPIHVDDFGSGSYAVYVTFGLFTADTVLAPVSISATGVPSFNLLSFYSNSDTQFKCQFYHGANLKFEGYLVQDDCTEIMVDYIHEIVLSFTDNLGLLKDVALDANNPDFGGHLCTAYCDFVSPLPTNNSFVYLFDSKFIPAVGVPFTITGHIDPAVNTSYTPTAVTNYRNGNFVVQVADGSVSDSVQYACRITDTGAKFDFYGRQTLLNIIAVCIKNTNLALPLNVYANIFDSSHTTDDSYLGQTFVDCKTFIDSNNFKNCYEVLTEILSTHKLTLFQSEGKWNIIRWQELRYHTTFDIPGYTYDADFYLTGTTTFSQVFTVGLNEVTYPENGLTRSIIRPYNFDKETFNYAQPKLAITNSDLAILGTFDSTSSSGGFDFDLYEFPESSKWLHFFDGDPLIDTSKICVKKETATGKEVDRYILQPRTNSGGGTTTDFACVQFNDIQVTAGDRFDFNIKTRSNSTTGGLAVDWRWGFMLCPDEGSYYGLNSNGTWSFFAGAPNAAANGFTHGVPAADAEDFYDFTLSTFLSTGKMPAFPIDGVLRIRVYGANTTSGAQPVVSAIWKDISIIIEQSINQSTSIIGQIHNASQSVVIKNNSDTTLTIDDSPRSSISGTLFQTNYTGLILNRTLDWYRLGVTETRRLGDIITTEQEVWRQIPRTKLEGTFYGLVNTYHISMLAILSSTLMADTNFIFGNLEIDYRNNLFSGTQYEIYVNGEESITRATITYLFTYIYNQK